MKDDVDNSHVQVAAIDYWECRDIGKQNYFRQTRKAWEDD